MQIVHIPITKLFTLKNERLLQVCFKFDLYWQQHVVLCNVNCLDGDLDGVDGGE